MENTQSTTDKINAIEKQMEALINSIDSLLSDHTLDNKVKSNLIDGMNRMIASQDKIRFAAYFSRPIYQQTQEFLNSLK